MTHWQEWGWLEWSAFSLATICGYGICIALVVTFVHRGGRDDDRN